MTLNRNERSRRFAGVILVTVLTCQAEVAGEMRSVWDRVYSNAQAKRGEKLYRIACESCHAPDLSGGKVVPELIGNTFTEDWDGLSVGRLFERVLLSMPEEDPGSVSRYDKADILAFILKENGFPSGQGDLQAEMDLLDRVRFEATKP
jgi:cytochrome c